MCRRHWGFTALVTVVAVAVDENVVVGCSYCSGNGGVVVVMVIVIGGREVFTCRKHGLRQGVARGCECLGQAANEGHRCKERRGGEDGREISRGVIGVDFMEVTRGNHVRQREGRRRRKRRYWTAGNAGAGWRVSNGDDNNNTNNGTWHRRKRPRTALCHSSITWCQWRLPLAWWARQRMTARPA